MNPSPVYCFDCNEWMQVRENGVVVPFGVNGDVRRGDRWECSVCGKSVVANCSEPYSPKLLRPVEVTA